MNDAISSGNRALEDRLRQLQSIINTALFALQQTVNYGVDKLDAAMQSNVRLLTANAQQLVVQFGFLANTTMEKAQGYLRSDLDKLQSTLGKSIAQIEFLNTIPIVNVPDGGFSVLRSDTAATKLYITGVGMTKDDVTPEVKLLQAGKIISGVRVVTKSMPLVEISVPNWAIKNSGDYELSFVFCKGTSFYFLKEYTTQQFPLRVCDQPRFHLKARLWVEGDGWELRRRNLNEGNLAGGTIYGVQTPGGNGNSSMHIVARSSPEWELYDPGWGRLLNCVVNSSNGYNAMSYEKGNGCFIYCDGRSGDSHLNVVVQVAERRRTHLPQCGPTKDDERELIGTVKSHFEFSQHDLNGSCDAGLVLKALVTMPGEQPLTDLVGNMADGQVAVKIADNVASFVTNPRCIERLYGKVKLIH
jgi:hypothetical protein